MKTWLSPKEYHDLHPGLGIETIKKMVRTGELEGYISNNGSKIPRYFIKNGPSNEGNFSKEYVESVIRENAELKMQLATIKNIVTGVSTNENYK